MKNFIILGGSRGLGDALSKGMPEKDDHVWIVSRSTPGSLNVSDGVIRSWIKADLSDISSSEAIGEAVKEVPVDVLVYNSGIWETKGFKDDYDFEKDSADEISNIISVNLTSAITSIQKLLPNLKKATKAKIILIGSTAGLENAGSKQVSYVASKFGLRGVGNSIREHVRRYGIGVTVINLGEIAETPYEEGPEKAILDFDGSRIPVNDIVQLVKCIISLSGVSCVKEVDMPAMEDLNA